MKLFFVTGASRNREPRGRIACGLLVAKGNLACGVRVCVGVNARVYIHMKRYGLKECENEWTRDGWLDLVDSLTPLAPRAICVGVCGYVYVCVYAECILDDDQMMIT